ncbi:MAG: peroxidase-related enzyme [Acidobacteriaceae bacterium]
MAHIALEEGVPGIVAAFGFRPETAKPMRELAEILLRGPNSLTSAEREAIAAVVSNGNECRFCQLSHSAAAAEHRGGREADYAWIESVKANPESADVSPKLRTLLRIASKVRESGKKVTAADVAAAREQGATDMEIHDTVLIAAAFSMYNRYVDGLATWQPESMEAYKPMGKRMAQEGYARPAGETVGAR